MGSLFVTGACHAFLGVGTGRSGLYLGTSEGTPHIDIIPAYQEVRNDIGGDTPMDTSYQGRRGVISYDFTRWNEAVLAKAAASNPFSGRPAIAGSSASLFQRGLDFDYDIGALMLTEGYAYDLWVVFPFAIKSTYLNRMVAGYHFPCCFLDAESHHSLGSRPKKVRLVWHALRVFVPQPIALIFPPPPKTPPLSTTPQVPSMLHGDSRDDRLAEERKIQAEANRKANEKAAEEVARRQRAEAKKLRDLTKSLLSSMTGSYVLYDFNIPSNLVVE